MPATCQYGQLSPSQLAHDLAIPDLSDPADGPHAIQQLTGLAAASLASAWNLEPGDQVRWCRGPRVVPVADNYDRLGYDPADITRAVRYTRYVDDQTMQRSHATAMVPPALRQLARDRAADVLLVCPGITYRRDVIDWQHSGTPHQLDLWRQERRLHPYTTDGRQIDVRTDRGWVEIGECGLAHPDVLARAGLADYAGLAIGLGLDRLLMLRKDVPDIRLLRSGDDRVASQMLDLTPYRPVSAQPAARTMTPRHWGTGSGRRSARTPTRSKTSGSSRPPGRPSCHPRRSRGSASGRDSETC
jgi:phenylalanyl-tRNA synthetase alpha chain